MNLSRQGALQGAPPITVDTLEYEVLLVNGAPNSNLIVTPYDHDSTREGTVCIQIVNAGYTPSGGQLSVLLQARNGVGTRTNSPGTLVIDGSGPTVSQNDLQSCEEGVSVPVNQPPVVTADDRTVNDTDGQENENVSLSASASDPDGDALTYEWFRSNGKLETLIATGEKRTVSLADGVSLLRVRVTDTRGASASAEFLVTVNATVAPNANAGADRVVNDTDRAAGEAVVLDASASTDPDGTIVSYAWSLLDGDSIVNLGSRMTPTLDTRLPDGANTIQLEIRDNVGNTATDTVLITVTAPSSSVPTANAGDDRIVEDTDNAAGENVVLNGSASMDADGAIVNYAWSRIDGESTEELGSGASPTLSARLPDGENLIRLVITDNSQNSASDTVLITVNSPASAAPTANAGADRSIADSDREEGEDVVLDGSASVDPDGTIVSYAWWHLEGDSARSLGSGSSPTLQTRLPDGDNLVQLIVTDNSGQSASDTALITVSAGIVITTLADLPGLSPKQKQTALTLDRICAQLRDQSGGEGGQLTSDQLDLLNRCNGLQINNTAANQVAALEEIVPNDFAIARTQTLLFATTQYAGVMDRLLALRGGAKGLSLAGLNIMVDGKLVPLAQLQDMAKGLLGGGASADEPDGLLSDKWGLWARGNYSFGDKDRSPNGPAFDAKQWAMLGGVDYRFSDQLVAGASLAYGQSSIDLDGGEGGLDTDTWAVSLYGSSYAAKLFYFDAILNVANADYGADRTIVYVDGAGLVDADARGETGGATYSVGLSGGRDFLIGGLTLSPTLGLFYIDATIDGFTERGAGGLNLIYDEQSFQSFTGNLGFRATYAWNLPWGVLLPHLRVDYVREFKDDVDVFGVRFAADPNAASVPPILVETDNPDQSYWRLATGFSAQFIHGISSYIEYQRLQSFEYIDFQDVSLGLRFQTSF